jgi:hypothetical protein
MGPLLCQAIQRNITLRNTMRKIVIAGNWKMNKTVAESVKLAAEVVAAAKDIKNVVVAIAPTYLALAKVAEVVKGSNVKLAAQDVHWENQGAFTGKVSADMLKEIGVDFVIIGHSEQRSYFGETDETVNKKVRKVLSLAMTPIICIGETLAERKERPPGNRTHHAGQRRLCRAFGRRCTAHGHRLRTGLGHRHRRHRQRRRSAAGARLRPRPAGQALRRWRRPVDQHPVRWLDETRERGRPAGAEGHRRWSDRWCGAQGGQFPGYRHTG